MAAWRRAPPRRRHAPPPSAGAAARAATNGDGTAADLENLGLVSADDDPQQRASGFDQRDAIGRALAELPVEQRLPLELAYYRGMTQFEVATLLSVPLGTIKTRMRLGLQQLRKVPELSTLWSER